EGDERGARGASPAELAVTAGTGTPPPLVERGSVGDGGAGASREATDGGVGGAPEIRYLALESGWQYSEDIFEDGSSNVGGPRYSGREAKEEASGSSVAAPVAIVARAATTAAATGDQERGLAVQEDGEKGAGPEP
ncbi:unnamed protein product, partial [Laminaria digitata]